ncbi:MAG: hypothetical protein AAB225_05240 [Acidobacteriota bacterium]
MANAFTRTTLRLVSPALPGRAQDWLVRSLSQPLAQQFYGQITDQFLELLLRGMDLAFALSRDYRRNIEGFRATYVWKTRDGSLACSAVFHDGNMTVDTQARPNPDVLITFKDARALWAFLLSEDQDALDSILANTVEVEGNLNYIYKYGFLARDLSKRLGVL